MTPDQKPLPKTMPEWLEKCGEKFPDIAEVMKRHVEAKDEADKEAPNGRG